MRSCIHCKKKIYKIISHTKDRKIVECLVCGLATVDTTKSLMPASKTFFQEYLQESLSYENYFNNKTSDINKLSAKGKLLDIGCGPGTFIKLAKKSGWDIVGLDTSKYSADICRQQNLPVICGEIKSSKLKKDSFDFITAFQLIEHSSEPNGLLNEAYRLLKPGGYLVLTTPNKKGFLARLMGSYWFGYYNLEHCYFFTPETLKSLVKAAGFEVIFCKTEFGRKLSLNYIMDRLLNYYYTPDTGIYKFLAKFYWIARQLDKYFIIREPYVNIYLAARKPVQ